MRPRNKMGFLMLALAAALMLGAVACASEDTGVSQEDYDALASRLDASELQATQLQDQLASVAPVNVIQTGQLVPAPAGSAPTGWANEESERGGLHLIAQYDSSGPDAWDASEHPLVYFTSESSSNPNPDRDDEAPYFAGFHIIDAYDKEVIAAALFSYEGNLTRGPHGVGVSPDGKWAYVGFSETQEGASRLSYIAIVNVRTLKMDKLLLQQSYFEGGLRSQALHHIQGWTDHNGNDRVIIQWGFGANGGPHHILDPNSDNEVVRSLTYDDIKPMGHPFTTPSPDGRYVYVSMGANWIRSNHSPAAGVAKYDIETGEHEVIEGVGHHPIGITHTQDGKFTYVVDGHGSHVYKIDNETNEVVGSTSAGVAGPYGIALNWDETRAYLVGKGEGSHNRGGVLGLLDTTRMRQSRELHQMPIQLGGSASSVDHAILHPDPDVNELWVSNMNGWETIIVDLDTGTAVEWIATPNGGDTHSGAFVRYDASWNGTLEADMGGPKSAAMKAAVAAKAAAAGS